MAGGRPPKPSALKLIQGTARKDRVRPDEPKPAAPVKLPPAPSHLCKIAKAEWRRVGRHLITLGLLTHIDIEALAQYCKAVAAERECCGRLAKWNMKNPDHPNLMKTGTTPPTYKTHPWVTQRDNARKHILDYAKEFGMTPSSRTRVAGLAAAPKVNKFDKY